MTYSELLAIIGASPKAGESRRAFVDRLTESIAEHEATLEIPAFLGRNRSAGNRLALVAQVARLNGQNAVVQAARQVLAQKYGLELIFRREHTIVRPIITPAMRRRMRS